MGDSENLAAVGATVPGGGRGARCCARPGCGDDARATLAFRYGARTVTLGPLAARRAPEEYDLCSLHADRTLPPQGWQLCDERPAEQRPPPPIGGPETVARLAAALRGSPAREPTESPNGAGPRSSPDPPGAAEDPGAAAARSW